MNKNLLKGFYVGFKYRKESKFIYIIKYFEIEFFAYNLAHYETIALTLK
jgi:hypothetical protein